MTYRNYSLDVEEITSVKPHTYLAMHTIPDYKVEVLPDITVEPDREKTKLYKDSIDAVFYLIRNFAYRHALEDRLMIHAGAVSIDGKGVLILAGEGAGKTTRVAELLEEENAAYAGDDIILIDDNYVIAYNSLLKFDNDAFLDRNLYKSIVRTNMGYFAEPRDDKKAETPLKIELIVIPNPLAPKGAKKLSNIDKLLEVYTQTTRLIRAENFIYNDFTEAFDSLDSKELADKRLEIIRNSLLDVDAYVVGGNPKEFKEVVLDLLKS